jgi:hypothetical protein
MSIQIRQSEETWFVKLYHENWRIPKQELEEALKIYPEATPAHVSLKLEPGAYLTKMPEEEIPCKNTAELHILLDRIIGLKTLYGKINSSEVEFDR